MKFVRVESPCRLLEYVGEFGGCVASFRLMIEEDFQVAGWQDVAESVRPLRSVGAPTQRDLVGAARGPYAAAWR